MRGRVADQGNLCQFLIIIKTSIINFAYRFPTPLSIPNPNPFPQSIPYRPDFPNNIKFPNGMLNPKPRLTCIIFNQIMNEQYPLTKLSEIRQLISPDHIEFSAMGVVVDCTTPHRKDTKKDYCLKLKIIDQSSINDPCNVFLFSRNDDDFPSSIKVGDILLLRKYQFQIWKDSTQAKKQYKVLNSQFRFYTGQPTAQAYGQIGNQPALDDFDQSILGALRELRIFSQSYFKKHSVPLFSKNSQKSSDFDLILQVKSTEKLNEGYKIYLSDSNNSFEIHYPQDVPPAVYKIRSIAELNWSGKCGILSGNDYTCFLQIPGWMKSHDPKQWEKLAHSRHTGDGKAENETLSTKILNEKKNEKLKEVKLADLVSQDIHSEEVMVVCEFIQCFTAFPDALRRFDSHNHTEKHYESSQGEYIYSVHYVITDESLQDELYNVYLYTYDNRGLEFLPGLHPSKIFGRNILSYQEKYDHINDRLLEETDLETNPLRIVLSPMTNGRDTIYRIVDTELIM